MPYKITDRKTELPWKAQKKVDGVKYVKQFKTKKEALAWESQLEKQRTILSQDLETIATWAIKYLDYAKAKHVHKTYLGKLRAFKLMFLTKGFAKEMPVDSLTPALALKFLTEQFEKHGGTAANNYRKDLHAAWEWGIDFLNLSEINPFHRIKKFANRKRPRYVPSLEDFWKVLDAAEGQERALILTYLHTAARRSELFRLRWEDVDFGSKRIRLVSRKNKSAEWISRYVSMTDTVQELLREQEKRTGQLESVFACPKTNLPYVYWGNLMPTLCEKAGVKPFGFHGIRHLSASAMAVENVPMVEIQQILGHSNLGTTELYIKSLTAGSRGVHSLPVPQKPKGPLEGPSDIHEKG